MSTGKPIRKQRRLASCYKCDHHRKLPLAGITCGKPLMGEWINVAGEQVHLCGCVMEIKTSLAEAKCPIGRW